MTKHCERHMHALKYTISLYQLYWFSIAATSGSSSSVTIVDSWPGTFQQCELGKAAHTTARYKTSEIHRYLNFSETHKHKGVKKQLKSASHSPFTRDAKKKTVHRNKSISQNLGFSLNRQSTTTQLFSIYVLCPSAMKWPNTSMQRIINAHFEKLIHAIHKAMK